MTSEVEVEVEVDFIPPGCPPGGHKLADAPPIYLPREIIEDYKQTEKEYDACERRERDPYFDREPARHHREEAPVSRWSRLSGRLNYIQQRANFLFMNMLRSEKLIAYGVPLHTGDGFAAVRIPPSYWDVMRPDFPQNSAKSESFNYGRIRVYLRSEIESVPKTSVGSLQNTSGEKAKRSRGRAGRPTCMPEIKAEFFRRRDSGESYESIVEESKHLAEWAKNKFPSVAPKPKHIRKSIKDMFSDSP